jgi:hypothetical protein
VRILLKSSVDINMFRLRAYPNDLTKKKITTSGIR